MSASAAIARSRLDVQLGTDREVRALTARHDAAIAKKDQQLRVVSRVHEATRPTRSRKSSLDWGSADNIVGQDAMQLRIEARRLERDHDISRNALNVLEQNTVGSGIDVMPAPRLAGEAIDLGLAQALRDLWDDWWDRPEVTKRHDFGKCQQLMARSAFRDGEVFYQTLPGPVAYLEHGTAVPFSLEMLEADMVPLDFNQPQNRIRQGIEVNAWGEFTAFHVYKTHPGDPSLPRAETKRVPAEFMRQVAMLDRIHQMRGLSIFASVITRLADIKEYEDSERIAAKVAASLSAQIIKGDAASYGQASAELASVAVVPEAGQPYRALTMRPGLIADDLFPGERVELIDSKRPNPNTETFRSGQLRAAAGGFNISYSSLSLDYDGTYSSQRQELVEKWGAYQKMGEWYIALVVRPIWREFVNACVLANLVRIPRGWTLKNLAAASYVRPVMPWIDPLKEAKGREIAEDRNWISPQRNVLEMSSDPEDVLQQRAEWDARRRELGIENKPSTNAAAVPDEADEDEDGAKKPEKS